MGEAEVSGKRCGAARKLKQRVWGNAFDRKWATKVFCRTIGKEG